MTDFGFNTKTDEVLRGIDLTGTLALVTGASSGLGVETARALVAHGAEVIGAVRDLAKADAATASVREAAKSGGGRLELVELDLADLASVRACTDRLIAKGRPLDLVIANAGVMVTPYGLTKDGFETQFGTNVLGHFVLVNRLAALMRAGSRLVMLSSAAHGIADVDLEDPNFERADYEPWTAYGRSKTGDALIAVEFDRRHRDRGIRAAAVHPGGIRTELQRHYSQEEEATLVASINRTNAAAGLPPFQYKTVGQGAATTLWAAVVSAADAIGGRYCEDCHVAPISEGAGIAGGVRPYAVDPTRAQALWETAEHLVDERF
jgi:NAD(P)-dependent dehydrogenase (short-subunit alcohol dehydrogenase family)